jgi:hypothetical protein
LHKYLVLSDMARMQGAPHKRLVIRSCFMRGVRFS